ncbi:DUF1707 SHOCT-like domain-containing protein [Actinomadura alba]|uniref:DUF1707 domain-containing protein n=1 Tax=Actinomadura alba TaxID=406431 RepID=A0ABR7LZ07_9ACTN|nr:DUF1707 domain-containing protein [Actinomadura alba]MBC6469991.1 DUF1707 domain-containing protein [Actinomadura alba]
MSARGGFGERGGFDHPDHLRVGDAERDEVAVSLHDHFAQGRLSREELDERLEAALGAKTAGDLREVTRDLPDPRARSGWRDGGKEPWPGHGPGAVRAHGMPHHAAPWHGGPPRWDHRRHRRRGFAPPLIGLLLIAVMIAGPGWVFAGVLKAVLIGWLILAGAGLFAHRRWHRLHAHRDPHALR